jgi:hypothetical protein
VPENGGVHADEQSGPVHPEVAGLFERLAAVEIELAAWQADINRVFAERFDVKAAFNERPSSEFGPSILAASAHARRKVGTGPEARAFEFLDVFCERYLASSDSDRAAMRSKMTASKATLNKLSWYMGRCRRELESTADARWLRLALAAASLSDRLPDYRDLYVSLGSLYQASLRVGIEPGPFFDEAGRLSSAEPDDGRGMSTRRFLAEFERSAYFGSIRGDVEADRQRRP